MKDGNETRMVSGYCRWEGDKVVSDFPRRMSQAVLRLNPVAEIRSSNHPAILGPWSPAGARCGNNNERKSSKASEGASALPRGFKPKHL